MPRPRSEVTEQVLEVFKTAHPDAVLTAVAVIGELQRRRQEALLGLLAPAEERLVITAVRCCAQRGELIQTGLQRGGGKTRPPMGYRLPRPGETAPERHSRHAERAEAMRQMLLAWGCTA